MERSVAGRGGAGRGGAGRGGAGRGGAGRAGRGGAGLGGAGEGRGGTGQGEGHVQSQIPFTSDFVAVYLFRLEVYRTRNKNLSKPVTKI